MVAAVADAVRSATSEPGSVGVITPDADIARLSDALTAAGLPHGRLDADHGDDEDRQVELVPASIAKGLEFDRVVVVEPARHRRRRARRAHRAAAALRRAHPRRLGAERRPLPAASGGAAGLRP